MRSIHFPGRSIKDFRFFRVVRISVSNRFISLVDAPFLSYVLPATPRGALYPVRSVVDRPWVGHRMRIDLRDYWCYPRREAERSVLLEEYVVNPIIAEHQHAIVQTCRRFRVARLDVFGSAAQGDFDEQSSDLDFLVDFGDVPDAERFDAFFGLQRALAELFDRPVDLVEAGAPRNPYFIHRLNESRRLVYAA